MALDDPKSFYEPVTTAVVGVLARLFGFHYSKLFGMLQNDDKLRWKFRRWLTLLKLLSTDCEISEISSSELPSLYVLRSLWDICGCQHLAITHPDFYKHVQKQFCELWQGISVIHPSRKLLEEDNPKLDFLFIEE